MDRPGPHGDEASSRRRSLRVRSHPPPASAAPIASARISPPLGPPLGGGGPWSAAATPIADGGALGDAGCSRGDGSGDRRGCDGRADTLAAAVAEIVAAADAGSVLGDAAGFGDGDGLGGMQTAVSITDGGRACVDPASPEPHTHPSTSPSATIADAAPSDDHIQPPSPSPRQ
jgi:hypothetical protein